MKIHQGGGRSSQAKSQATTKSKSQKRYSTRFVPINIEQLGRNHKSLVSRRKVREIVTVSGRGVRGYFPSYKGRLLKFESLVEEAGLRVCEVAGSVSKIVTQPCVLEFGSDDSAIRYTPDFQTTINGQDYLVEVKADNYSKSKHTVSRLREVIAYMRSEDLPFILIVEDDVRAAGLQDELNDLLRKRPAPRRFDSDLDATHWDPRNHITESSDLVKRWRGAQQMCDALLERVMRRDPDSLLDVLSN